MENQQEAVMSKMVKSKSSTYFIDVKEARNKTLYLQITQSTVDQNNEKKRYTIRVFDSAIEEFAEAIRAAKDCIKTGEVDHV